MIRAAIKRGDLRRRIQFMRNGLLVRRYHQHTLLEPDTVGKHSAGVACFVHMIDPDASKEVILAAVCHDLGEYVLGDIPAPTKRLLDDKTRAELDRIEDEAITENGFAPTTSPLEYKLLKIADYFDGYSFATEERRRGSTVLTEVANRYETYIQQLLDSVPPGTPWFSNAKEIYSALRYLKEEAYGRQ